MRRIYHRKLWGEIITGNYEEKLSQEIMGRNYHRKLSASIYHHAKNVGIIEILPYPKIKSKRKRGTRCAPLSFRGKGAENCSHNVGKGGRVGLTLKFDELLWPAMTFEVILLLMKYLRINNIGIHINFYQNRFINESVRKNFLKFP